MTGTSHDHHFRLYAFSLLAFLLFLAAGSGSVVYADPVAKSDNNPSPKHRIAGIVPVDLSTGQPLGASSGSSLGTSVQPGCNTVLCTDPVCPVDIVAPRVGDYVAIRITLYAPTAKEATFQITSEDGEIAKALDVNSGSENPIVTIPAGGIHSSAYKVHGYKIGSTRFRHVPYNDYARTHYPTFPLSVGVWDFNGFLDFNALGAGDICYDAGEGQDPTKVSSLIDVRTTCGGNKVKGVRADGASRLLLRAESGVEGRACFKVISDLQPDPGTITDPFPAQDPEDPFNVLTEPYNEKHWAYSTYTPPQNFINTQDKEREVEVEIAFTPKNPFSKDYTFTLPVKTREKVKVRRPPVILVHGIWSGKKIWPTSFTAPDPQDGWKIEAIDYPNSSHFKGSATTLQNEISRVVKDERSREKIATTKADVIAHSMGGLVSRAFISDANMYLRPNNFKEGDIRKLITLDTPHQGSQLANLLVSIHDSFPHAKLAGLETRITGPSGNFHEGALCDLAENSQGIGLGAISGNILARAYNSTGGAYSSSGSLTFPLGILTRIYTSDYFW